MSGLAALRIGIGLETFWQLVDSLPQLSLVLRTCQCLHLECDPIFAVASMRNKGTQKVQKVWAQRWLGLCHHWQNHVKADEFTLLRALKIARAHGGVGKNYKRGVKLQLEMHPAQKAKLAAVEKRRQFLRDNHAAVERKQQVLNALLVTEGVPEGHFDADIPQLDLPIDDALIERMKARYARHVAFVQSHVYNKHKMAERKTKLDERLVASALPACSAGSYYWYIIMMSKAVIDNKMIDELCFRAQFCNNVCYDDVLEGLVAVRGHFYAGVHAEARTRFCRMLSSVA